MHVLAALWDGGGTVPVEVGVVRRLVARGHEVTALADPPLEPALVAAGAAFRPWIQAPHRRTAQDPDLVQDAECRTPLQVLDRLLHRLVAGPAEAFAADVETALRLRPADVLVVDGALLGALIAAEAQDLPAVALCPNVYLRPSPELPPFGSGLRPARGPVGRARDRVLAGAARRLWARGLPALDAVRSVRGLGPLPELWGQWDLADRVLVLTSAAFDLPARLPANVRYVGPVLDDPEWITDVDPPRGEGPLVVASLSSTRMRGDVDTLRRIVAALDLLPVRGVVSTGPAVDPAEVPGRGSVSVVRAAPHASLFADADVVITHAGHGTLIKALAAGAPVLCLPMGRDQRDNAVRAERHGAVLRLRPTASPSAIAAAVRRLLDEPSFRANARQLGARLNTDAASTRLVDEIEGTAARRDRSAPPPTRGDAR